jgi:hypothetical protein
MGYSGAGGKLIDEKNQEQKILWHCPFKQSQNKYIMTVYHLRSKVNLILYWLPGKGGKGKRWGPARLYVDARQPFLRVVGLDSKKEGLSL